MTSPVMDQFRLSDFDFDLPESLIAQEPASTRDASRLMVLARETGSIEHRVFADIVNYLRPGDVLVLNDTKVFPCRLAATKPGGGKAELFLLREESANAWSALVKGGARPGMLLALDRGIRAVIEKIHDDATASVRFQNIDDIRSALPEIGCIPLPPYIKRQATETDRIRYQTVYAEKEGAVAAPTAGLHFSSDLLARLQKKGIETALITLHVGPGTFQPVRSEKISEHRMLPERYEISPDAAGRINRAKAEGRRVIAVGTTSVRTLEAAAGTDKRIKATSGSTELFIVPGHAFTMIDGLITNFHLPKSTLLMLVAAFAGKERILAAYREAVQHQYRFYSYGDAMAIL